MELIYQLNKLAAEMQDITKYINYGGCCVVAAAVAPLLKKQVPTKIRVAAHEWYYENINLKEAMKKVNRELIDDCYQWNDNGVYFGHVYLEFEYNGITYYFDSDGVSLTPPIEEVFRTYEGNLTHTAARKLASNSSNWNSVFPRSTIPDIRRAVHKFGDWIKSLTLEPV